MKRMIDNKEFEAIKNDVDDSIKKSDTSGLVKNDGTIDTNAYAKTSDLDKGTYYTNTQPTSADDLFTLESSYIINVSTGISVKNGDLIIYIDSLDDKVKELYNIVGRVGTTLTLSKIGAIAGGKQLYQHNIRIGKYDYSQPINVYTTIITNSATAMDKTAFKDYIFNNFPTANDAMLLANGTFNNDKFNVIGIKQTTPQGQGTTFVGFIYLDSSNDIQHVEWSQSSYSISDIVIAL